MGFGLVNRFIDHLQGVTTNNYNTISDLHTLQITHAKSSQFAFNSRFPVTDLNNEDSPASVLTSLLSGGYPATELTQPAWRPRYIASERTQQKTPPPAVFLLLWAVA
jgi:hypothetical protein